MNQAKRPQRDSKAAAENADGPYRAASDHWAPCPTRQMATGRGQRHRVDESSLNSTSGWSGIVEPALARALGLAAEAGRWDVVEQIARELKERRQDREDAARPVAVRLHQSSARS